MPLQKLNPAQPVSSLEFSSGLIHAFSGNTIDTTFYYKASVTYQDNGSTATLSTPVKTTRFNPIPAITINKKSYTDGVRYQITFSPNSNVTSKPYFYYRFPGDSTDQ
ncbi:MAG: hypothetical protein SCM11_12360 [Bacillota bacterium]|nr:hypothetical protein [Bacillota bacterium]